MTMVLTQLDTCSELLTFFAAEPPNIPSVVQFFCFSHFHRNFVSLFSKLWRRSYLLSVNLCFCYTLISKWVKQTRST